MSGVLLVVRIGMALAGLVHLGKGPNKATVLKAFNRSFIHRDERPEKQPLEAYMGDFGLSETEAQELASGLQALIQPILYTGDVAEMDTLLAEDGVTLDARLVGLIKQILTVQLPEWKDACIAQRPSLPRMVDLDWRVDLKASSDGMRKIPLIPSVLLEFEVEEQQTRRGVLPSTEKVNVELSRQALGTMLEGLRKIKDQLSSVAGEG